MIKDKAFAITLSIFFAIAIALVILFFVFPKAAIFSLITLLPIAELRLSVILGLVSFKWPIWVVYPIAVILNSLVTPLVFLFLDHLHPIFYKKRGYKKFFDRFIIKSRIKLKGKIEKFGMLGIMLFIGIPLPITGAYTGTAGAWILGLNRKKTFLAAVGGVMMSGVIMCTLIILSQQINLPQWLDYNNAELPRWLEKLLSHFISNS